VFNPTAELFETVKVATKMIYEWKPSHAYHKIDTFHKHEWDDTKEDTGKFIKNTCMHSAIAKGTSRPEATLSSEKI